MTGKVSEAMDFRNGEGDGVARRRWRCKKNWWWQCKTDWERFLKNYWDKANEEDLGI